jgi:hypothetical protein
MLREVRAGPRQIDNRRHHAKPALGFAWRSQFQPEAAEIFQQAAE